MYRTLRELVMSYFEHYYNLKGEKTLRAFSRPVNLNALRSPPLDHCRRRRLGDSGVSDNDYSHAHSEDQSPNVYGQAAV